MGITPGGVALTGAEGEARGSADAQEVAVTGRFGGCVVAGEVHVEGLTMCGAVGVSTGDGNWHTAAGLVVSSQDAGERLTVSLSGEPGLQHGGDVVGPGASTGRPALTTTTVRGLAHATRRISSAARRGGEESSRSRLSREERSSSPTTRTTVSASSACAYGALQRVRCTRGRGADGEGLDPPALGSHLGNYGDGFPAPQVDGAGDGLGPGDLAHEVARRGAGR